VATARRGSGLDVRHHAQPVRRSPAPRSRGAPSSRQATSCPRPPSGQTQADRLEIRDLDRLLQRLAPEQREVLLLVAVEELSYREVAFALAIPVGTVMSRLSRARAWLRPNCRATRPQARRSCSA
jgi:RNA polymerase sigma-70 factor (ECF subfamily)